MTRCPKCREGTVPGDRFCAKCGYQLERTAEERRQLYAQGKLQQDKHRYEEAIQSGRRAILWLAILLGILTGAGQLWYRAKIDEAEVELGKRQLSAEETSLLQRHFAAVRKAMDLSLVLDAVQVVFFIGLWVVAKWRPLAATLSAMLLFLALQAIVLVTNPLSFFNGALFKVIILFVLGYAIAAAWRLRTLRQAESGA